MNNNPPELYFTKAQLQYLKDRFPPYTITPEYNDRTLMWSGGTQEVIAAVEAMVR